MRLFLYDDATARSWEPFRWSRPTAELRFGAWTPRERLEQLTGVRCEGILSRPELVGFSEPGAPPVVDAEGLGARVRKASPDSDSGEEGGTEGRTEAVLLWNSRAVPAPGALDDATELGHPQIWIHDGAILGVLLSTSLLSGSAGKDLLETLVGGAEGGALSKRLEELVDAMPRTSEGAGETITDPWSWMARNADRLRDDLTRSMDRRGPSPDPVGPVRIGTGGLLLDRTAQIGPGVILDTRDGPIRLGPRAEVRGPARLVGPLDIGAETVVFGGEIGRSSIGPACRIRGEVQDSIVCGWSNKAHDGHLGHAILGAWVNLGAGTTNSDLKNDYGPVRLRLPSGPVDTGLAKVGCFLGDHVKTGIGTLINTGTVVGPGSNLFGGRMPPLWVPPFSWGAGEALEEYRLEKFLQVARTVTARRGVDLDDDIEAMLRRAHADSAGLRKAVGALARSTGEGPDGSRPAG